jgi:O-acetyl-ADP-ribose deacetylase (regulator of RNase III)
MLGGGGVDGAIHAAAGPALLEACRAIPEVRPGVRCPTGEARVTAAFRLPARSVVHTVGPIWRGGHPEEYERLASCYQRSLALAKEHGARSIAFPAISTGVYGFPIYLASRIAARECATFLMSEPGFERILLVAFREDDAKELRDAVGEVTRPPARRADRPIQPLPAARAALAVERRYSFVELEWLKRGDLPRQMEDRWFVFYEEPWLYVHRSWTGACIYEVRFEPDGDGARIAEVLANRDPEQYRETDDSLDARSALLLLDGLVGRRA